MPDKHSLPQGDATDSLFSPQLKFAVSAYFVQIRFLKRPFVISYCEKSVFVKIRNVELRIHFKSKAGCDEIAFPPSLTLRRGRNDRQSKLCHYTTVSERL